MRVLVKSKLAFCLRLESLKHQTKQSLAISDDKQKHKKTVERDANYIFYGENEVEDDNDDIERQIEEYLRTIKSSSFDCPLKFWKSNQYKFPLFAKLAKKYLGIPESSAAVEGCSALLDIFSA